MRILIIENEILAQKNLKNIITQSYSDAIIVECLDSVKGAIEWFSNPENHIDIVFMDIELSDGMCFDIFDNIEINAKVIMTTAFDHYAIKAFKVNSVDYILKPIDREELITAIEKCRKDLQNNSILASLPHNNLVETGSIINDSTKLQKRFSVKCGNRIVIVKVEDIAYIYSEDKSTNLMTKNKNIYILDDTMDIIEEKLNPEEFFRVSRSVITSISSIDRINKQSTNRIKLLLQPLPPFDVFVSRFRIPRFLQWINL